MSNLEENETPESVLARRNFFLNPSRMASLELPKKRCSSGGSDQLNLSPCFQPISPQQSIMFEGHHEAGMQQSSSLVHHYQHQQQISNP